MFLNALVSVSDKTGLADFLRPFADKGMRIVSSGGTAQYLIDQGFEVTKVSEQTQFPEVMGGRVKTLHPFIHMPILQRKGVKEDELILKEYSLQAFDLMIVNLYPFQDGLKKNKFEKDMIELIDIGGPTLLRAAAKNFDSMTVLCDPSDYQWVSQKQSCDLKDRKKLAAKVFRHVSHYDKAIADYLSGEPSFQLQGDLQSPLRYGENPQQKAWWFKESDSGLHQAQIMQGKELSYNNILDLDAACSTLKLFHGPTVISVKHNNPCGVGQGKNIYEALTRSLKADPVSVFGGIIAMNENIDGACATELSQLFLECIIAPGWDEQAQEILSKKKNLRVLLWPQMRDTAANSHLFHSVWGGYLVQTPDHFAKGRSDWELVSGELNEEDWHSLDFAWRVCAALKSNAIAVTSRDQSLGLGMGQVNRVDAVEQALKRAHQFHSDKNKLYLASDAFFPFPDSIEVAHKNGVTAIIQPGGSIKDKDVIAKAKDLGLAMVFTGERHFRH